MKAVISETKLATWLSWLAGLVLVLLPFHAFLTVWLSSLTGHYTLWRLWKEFLLIILIIGAKYLLLRDKKLRQKMMAWWPARLILAYGLLLLLCGFVSLATHNVTGKAMWYGLLVNLRFLIFFLVVAVIAAKSDWLQGHWRQLLFAPAILVAAFAILQYWVLPYDFLRHFGYGPSTIFPYETINHSITHLRVASTLRGANPLGAYLLIPITALAVMLMKRKERRLEGYMLGAGLLLALIFSFSRGAWVGGGVSLIIIAWLSLKQKARKNFLLGFIAVLVVGCIALAGLHNNTGFENVVFHTDHTSKIAESSNEGHAAAFKSAGKDIIHEPFGRGVGTAGPESVYNNRPARVAENYYLQIGQEAGWLGMALFIAVCVVVGRLLWAARAEPLALALFAALIGLGVVNLLSHAWTDDTLAYIFWGLAGIVLSPKLRNT